MCRHQLSGICQLDRPLACHTTSVEHPLALRTDLRDALHRLEGLLEQVSVVSGGDVPAGRELECGVDCYNTS